MASKTLGGFIQKTWKWNEPLVVTLRGRTYELALDELDAEVRAYAFPENPLILWSPLQPRQLLAGYYCMAGFDEPVRGHLDKAYNRMGGVVVCFSFASHRGEVELSIDGLYGYVRVAR